MTNNQPIAESHAKPLNRILDLIDRAATDEITNLAEEICASRGVPINYDDDDFYEKHLEPIENEIWKAIIHELGLNP